MGWREQLLDVKERWESPGGVRAKINEHQKAVAILCAALIILSLGVLMIRGCGDGRPDLRSDRYYFNLDTREVVRLDPEDRLPPFTNRRDQRLVYAEVYTCTDCSRPITTEPRDEGPYIGFLAKYSDEALMKIASAARSDRIEYEAAAVDQLISADGENWHPQMSPEAKLLRSQRLKCDDGSSARRCP